MRYLRHALLCSALAISACNCDEGGDLTNVKPHLALDAMSLDFGEVRVNDLKVKGLKLTNEGDAVLSLKSVVLDSTTGEFTLGTAAPNALPASGTQDLTIVYQPLDLGEDTATLTIDADDEDGPRVVQLRGVGVRPGLSVTTTGPKCGDTESSMSFGAVVPGRTESKTITIEASGGSAVTINSIGTTQATSAEFHVDPLTAPKRLAPGEKLDVAVTYTPVDGGLDTGGVVIQTDAVPESTFLVTVCGEGVAPAICATPVPLGFGPVAQGQTGQKVLKIESCGREPLDLSAVGLSSDAGHPTDAAFTMAPVSGLPRTLAPGEFIEVSLSFAPPDFTARSGFVKATSNALGMNDAFFPIEGRGAMPCDLAVLPDMLTYSGVALGSSTSKNVVLINNGADSCAVTRMQITIGQSQFTVMGPTVPFTVQSGGSEQLAVAYSPSAAGVEDDGMLEVEAGAVQSVQLIGNPQSLSDCQMEITPTVLNFGGVVPGTSSSLAAEVKNISDEVCTIQGVDLAPGSDPAFLDTSSNFGLVFPGRSKQVTITFAPSRSGPHQGIVNIDWGSVGSGGTTTAVPLFGSGMDAGICVDPVHLAFGPQTAPSTREFRVYACGSRTVRVSALDWTNADPEMSLDNPPALPFTLAPGANQVVRVRYSPSDASGDTAIVTVRSDDPVDPAVEVTVTGGPEVVPISAGRYLYYWQITGIRSEVMRVPLQGLTTPVTYWGPSVGKGCSGCHNVSPDGRYVAIVETGTFRIVDTTADVALRLPPELATVSFFSWKPDVTSRPPYQFVYDNGQDLHIAALYQGYIGPLQGANDPSEADVMPSWGTDGRIAFTRGVLQQTSNGGGWGLQGASNILVVPETGGVSVPLVGASQNGFANYYPTFSPNARWIAMTQSRSAQSTIAATDATIKLVRSDGSGLVLDLPALNAGGGANSFPGWSRDGSFLSFSSNRSGGQGDWDIYIAPVDPTTGADSAARNLVEANTSAFEHSAQWSP
ncbi:MAG: choice-of-anchor D domain-containing protein [Deltaproteobacteria bacterium]|nr:choice-of-anchor D domain-containing protein [Deltaproteobacteria bacterium]